MLSMHTVHWLLCDFGPVIFSCRRTGPQQLLILFHKEVLRLVQAAYDSSQSEVEVDPYGENSRLKSEL